MMEIGAAANESTLRKQLQADQLSMQQAIANMNVASHNRQAATSAATAMMAQYTSMFASIMANPEIPADARAGFLEHAKNLSQQNLKLVESLYGAEIDWTVPVAPGTKTEGAVVPDNQTFIPEGA